MNQYSINGSDAFTTYGIVFKEGTLEQLMTLPERKPGVENNWPDEDGTERDLEVIKYQSREVAVNCVMIGNSKADFKSKYEAFKAFLKDAGYFFLLNQEFQIQWKLLYDGMEDYVQDDLQTASFTLNLIDDFPLEEFPI